MLSQCHIYIKIRLVCWLEKRGRYIQNRQELSRIRAHIYVNMTLVVELAQSRYRPEKLNNLTWRQTLLDDQRPQTEISVRSPRVHPVLLGHDSNPPVLRSAGKRAVSSTRHQTEVAHSLLPILVAMSEGRPIALVARQC